MNRLQIYSLLVLVQGCSFDSTPPESSAESAPETAEIRFEHNSDKVAKVAGLFSNERYDSNERYGINGSDNNTDKSNIDSDDANDESESARSAGAAGSASPEPMLDDEVSDPPVDDEADPVADGGVSYPPVDDEADPVADGGVSPVDDALPVCIAGSDEVECTPCDADAVCQDLVEFGCCRSDGVCGEESFLIVLDPCL